MMSRKTNFTSHLIETAFFLAVTLLLAGTGLMRGSVIAWAAAIPFCLITIAGLARAIDILRPRSRAGRMSNRPSLRKGTGSPPAAGIAVLLMLAMLPAGASELPPLRENTYINDRLLVAAIGDRIRRECDRIEPRRMAVRTEALQLLSHATNLGYDHATIEAYIQDRENQDWMRGRRDAWLVAQGAIEGDPESFCAIGVREIQRGNLLGSLLRYRK